MDRDQPRETHVGVGHVRIVGRGRVVDRRHLDREGALAAAAEPIADADGEPTNDRVGVPPCARGWRWGGGGVRFAVGRRDMKVTRR